MKAGITTVPFNLPVDGEEWHAFIGTDPEKKGGMTGKYLNDALGGKGKIVALGGLPGNSYTAGLLDRRQEELRPRHRSARVQGRLLGGRQGQGHHGRSHRRLSRDRRHLGRWRSGRARRPEGAGRGGPAARALRRRRLQRPAQDV